MYNFGIFLTSFAILAFTVPSYCEHPYCSTVRNFNTNDTSADTIINQRVQQILNQLGNTESDKVLKSATIALNRLEYQKTELMNNEYKIHDFNKHINYGDYIKPEFFSPSKVVWYKTMSNIQNIVNTWVDLNHHIIDKTETHLKTLSTKEVLTTTSES